MGEEVLVDAIKDGEIITIPQSQAVYEELFILRRHAPVVENASAQAMPVVKETPWRTSSARSDKFVHGTTSVRWHSYQPDYLKNNVLKDLVSTFRWDIAKARKQRNMSRKQLADAVSEPEINIKMLESGELPRDDFVLINKVQKVLGINLRKDGKSFDMPSEKQAQQTQALPSNPSLADLQKRKEQQEPKSGLKFSSSDIEAF